MFFLTFLIAWIGQLRLFLLVSMVFLSVQPSLAGKYIVLDPLDDDIPTAYHKYLKDIPTSRKVLITWEKTFSEKKRQAVSNYFSDIILAKEYVLSGEVDRLVININGEEEIERIITAATTESHLIRAASLREYLGLPGQSYESALIYRDKVLMKRAVQHVVEIPAFQETNSSLDLLQFVNKHGYPVVVKPRRGVASININLIRNKEELDNFLDNNYNCHHLSDLLVETFVEGKLYRIDGFLSKGKLAVWPAAYLHPCLETALEGKVLGCYMLSVTNPLTSRLIEYTQKVLYAMPTPEETAFHLEVFVTSQSKIVFCEIASRVGGRTNCLWEKLFNIDVEEVFYNMQAGIEIPNELFSLKPPSSCPGYLVFPAGKQGGTIEHIEEVCPFDYCSNYIPYREKGEIIDASYGITNNVATIMINATTEEDFLEKAEEVSSWFKETFKYKDRPLLIN